MYTSYGRTILHITLCCTGYLFFLCLTFYEAKGPEKHASHFKSVISEHMLRDKLICTFYEIPLRWMPWIMFSDKLTLNKAMAWWYQATSHNPDQCCHMVLPGCSNLMCLTQGQFWHSDIVVACICLCVCVSMYPCVWGNPKLAHAITHHPFKPKPPNLDKGYKTVVLRPLLFWGWLTATFVSKFTLFRGCPHNDSWPFQVTISKFGPQVYLSTAQVRINFGLDWSWLSNSYEGHIWHSPILSDENLSCSSKLDYTLLRVGSLTCIWGGRDTHLNFCGLGHCPPVYLLFGAICWSRQPRVFRRLTVFLL